MENQTPQTIENTWKNKNGEIRPLFRRDKEVTAEQNDKDAEEFKKKHPGTIVERKTPSIDLAQLKMGIAKPYEAQIKESKK